MTKPRTKLKRKLERKGTRPTKPNKITRDLKMALWKRQHGKCEICGKPVEPNAGADIHHGLAQSAGGTDDISNLRLVHVRCHVAHHRRSGP